MFEIERKSFLNFSPTALHTLHVVAAVAHARRWQHFAAQSMYRSETINRNCGSWRSRRDISDADVVTNGTLDVDTNDRQTKKSGCYETLVFI